ncbi:uncharacterized protein Dvir_GJ26724 [Drosophila virilis]|uniref:Uncharacterized protein n=1 Tax=Drosophila virilis TaxID=7244 RepID=A0A0Q9WS59_DROVI|nr:uncharacterized protein Dvir_GJ26724 [Drosophila virilis]
MQRLHAGGHHDNPPSATAAVAMQWPRQQSHQSQQQSHQTRRHTIISTTLTNYNQQLAAAAYPRRASIGWDAAETNATMPTTTAAHKPVRITLIGEPLPQQNGGCHKTPPTQQNGGCHKTPSTQQNGVKAHFLNGCQSGAHSGASASGAHYQPLYNSNKMTSPTVTIV